MQIIITVLALVSQVSAHGMLNWPIVRIQPGDQQNGYTYSKAASNRNTNVHANPDINCSYLPKGPVFTQTMKPGPATIDYTITAWHNGGCIVYLSRDNQQTWEQIGVHGTCGIQTLNPTGRGSIPIVIPDGTYSAVLRWNWIANNGGAPNEIYNQCADIQVSPLGSNDHKVVELATGQPTANFTTILPRTGMYAGCSTVGATVCAGSDFINQCVSLPAGGGWAGGMAFYQYQCPNGAQCQTMGRVDKCVGGAADAGGAVPPPPPPSKTLEGSPTPATTTNALPVRSSVSVPTTTSATLPAPPLDTRAPCATPGTLLLPIPAGSTCIDVKHACQSFCISKQLYNIDRNQCFGEDGNGNANQWCACNGVTYYNVAFNTPTSACPFGTPATSPVPAPKPQPVPVDPVPSPSSAPVPEPQPAPVSSVSSISPVPSPVATTAPVDPTQVPVPASTTVFTKTKTTQQPQSHPTNASVDSGESGVSNGSSCVTGGLWACAVDGSIAVCSQGAWVSITCSADTKCTPMAGSVYCM
ncbi:hypothetical protein BC830DRAFT_1148887 [Chytriomyces sp. MP71]|nr:hypothetical protein BC830DRAFT_1148887 [Chytriomyces sp. MP71]